MAVKARPEPKDQPKLAPTTEELLVQMQRREKVDERLAKHLANRAMPAQLRGPFRLSAAAPIARDDAGHACASFAVWNPNPAVVYLSVGGASPRPGQGALSVPPAALVVFPLAIEDLELGADPAELAGGDAVVHVMRYETVQPAFLGAL